MRETTLDPSRALLANFTLDELARLAARSRVKPGAGASRRALTGAITKHLDLDELADAVAQLFPKPGRSSAGHLRLDRIPRLHGETTVQIYSRTSSVLGLILLEQENCCLALRCGSVPLFLENRWPVVLRDTGVVPLARLYAAYIRPRRIHPAAGAAPPKSKPFIVDEGEYGLRNGRLRLELKRSGLVSYRVSLVRLRPPKNQPEYLLLPIA